MLLSAGKETAVSSIPTCIRDATPLQVAAMVLQLLAERECKSIRLPEHTFRL
jgi:hypothetical protein